MFSFIVFLLISAIIAYAIYTSYFGKVQGDHINGINAMIFVQNDLRAKQELADQKKDSLKRSLIESAA